MRRPSFYAQRLLVELLNDAQVSPQALSDMLRELGYNQFDGAVHLNTAPKLALAAVVDAVSRAGLLGNDVLNQVEKAIPARGDELSEIRVEMELVDSPTALVDSQALRRMKQSALDARLHTGVFFARLQQALPLELKQRSAQIVNDKADVLKSWFDTANRQVIDPGGTVWMLDLLEAALATAPPAGKKAIQQQLQTLRITALGGDPRPGDAAQPAGGEGLEAIVNELGIAVDGGEFYGRMGQTLARVCLVRYGDADLGTGFLVGDDIVLTNHHVLAKVLGGSSPGLVSFVFDFRWNNGAVSAGVSVRLSTVGESEDNRRPWLIDSSEPTDVEQNGGNPDISSTPDDRLDFALVRLDRKIGAEQDINGQTRGHFELEHAGPPYGFPVGAALIIVGHRQGDSATKAAAATFAIEPNSLIEKNANGTRVRYRTNTMRGASGSPVLSLAWELVALHHFGKKHLYNQGIPTAAIASRPRVAQALV